MLPGYAIKNYSNPHLQAPSAHTEQPSYVLHKAAGRDGAAGVLLRAILRSGATREDMGSTSTRELIGMPFSYVVHIERGGYVEV